MRTVKQTPSSLIPEDALGLGIRDVGCTWFFLCSAFGMTTVSVENACVTCFHHHFKDMLGHKLQKRCQILRSYACVGFEEGRSLIFRVPGCGSRTAAMHFLARSPPKIEGFPTLGFSKHSA